MVPVIAQPCVDGLDRARVDECPVETTYYEGDPPVGFEPYPAGNERFFARAPPCREEALDPPGGATGLGPPGVDTPLVAGPPPQGPRKEEG